MAANLQELRAVAKSLGFLDELIAADAGIGSDSQVTQQKSLLQFLNKNTFGTGDKIQQALIEGIERAGIDPSTIEGLTELG